MDKKTILLLILLFGTTLGNAKTVIGKVVDRTSRKPISSTIVMISNHNKLVAIAESDSSGLFEINNLVVDKITLRVSRAGYNSITIGPLPISKIDTLRLLIEIEEKEIVLGETVIKEVSENYLINNKGFWKRKETLNGQFLTYADLKGRAFNSTSQLLQSIPQLKIRRGTSSGYGKNGSADIIYSTRTVGLNEPAVNIYLDGLPVENDGFINFLNPNDIAAIEYYSSSIDAPAEFGGMHKAGGVLLIWTKK